MANTTKNTTATTSTTKENGWERIARRNLKNAYNWLVGERENAVQDGDMTEKQLENWILYEALDEVYHEAITTKYTDSSAGGEAPKEMRFAGKEFCYRYLIKQFKKDGYTVTVPETETKTAKKSTTKKTTPKTVQATLLAFTGMKIAEYTAEVIRGGYRITTKTGKVLEFNKDGTQKVTDNRSNNPKFNNRLEIAGA